MEENKEKDEVIEVKETEMVNEEIKQDEVEVEKEVKTKNGKKKTIISVIIILLLLLVIGGLLYYRYITQTGRIELVLVDQNDLPVIGAEINLKKANGKNIGNVDTGADGKIKYYKVREGDYILEIIDMPEGYEVEDNSKIANISVEDNSTTYVKMTGERNIGYLKVTVSDENENVMKDVKVNIYDEEGFLLVSHTTNDDGTIYNVFPEEGIYHFDLAQNQDIISKYQLDTTMYRITVDDLNKTFIKEIKVKKDNIENVVAEESKNTTNVENVVAK